MIPVIIDCATFVAAVLMAIRIGTTLQKEKAEPHQQEWNVYQIVEIINRNFLVLFLTRTICFKWLSRIISTTAPEHALIKTKLYGWFLGAIYIRWFGHWLHVDNSLVAMVQFWLMFLYWDLFWEKENGVRECETEMQRLRDKIRGNEITIEKLLLHVQKHPSAKLERKLAESSAELGRLKEYSAQEEWRLFQGGHLRDVGRFR